MRLFPSDVAEAIALVVGCIGVAFLLSLDGTTGAVGCTVEPRSLPLPRFAEGKPPCPATAREAVPRGLALPRLGGEARLALASSAALAEAVIIEAKSFVKLADSTKRVP